MAVDNLVDSAQLDADLTSVANAIRTKGGTSSQMAFPAGFVSAVQAIPTGITPTGTKQISITQNGTTTEDVTNYANAEIMVNVSGGGGGRLPSGFQEVEYLGMSQNCYFALGARTYENIGFKTIFLLATRYNGYGPHFLSTTNNYIKFLPRNNGGTMIQFKGGSEKTSSTVIPLNNVATAEFNTDGNGVLTASWSGGSLSATPTAGTTTIGNIYLCAYANSPGTGDWSMNGLLYEFKLYNNGELVEDYVPCYRVSDGVIGLYDIILGNFYTNQGTGTITKGRDITDASAQALSILLGETE